MCICIAVYQRIIGEVYVPAIPHLFPGVVYLASSSSQRCAGEDDDEEEEEDADECDDDDYDDNLALALALSASSHTHTSPSSSSSSSSSSFSSSIHDPDAYIYQQDNASPHTAASTLEFIENLDVATVKWPSKSPDLNPAEHVWALMDKKIKAAMCTHTNPTRADLIAAINATADELQSPTMSNMRKNFISHVPIAMLECIAVGGGEPYKYHVRSNKI